MKRTTTIICLLLLCTLVFSSCLAIIPNNTVTGEQREDLGEKPLDEGVISDDSTGTELPKDDASEASSKAEKQPVTPDSLLEQYGAVRIPDAAIDSIALSFTEALKNADKAAVSNYVGGKSEYYDFLDNAGISSCELIPIDIIQDESSPFYGYYDYYDGKYMCIIRSNGSTEAFPSEECYYFLSTEQDFATGNEVTFFAPFEKLPELYHGIPAVPWKIDYFVDSFIDHYVSTLTLGKNSADTFDFHNISGYHFIPHMMLYFENNADMPHPYSINQINSFISSAFDGNEGIRLETWQDFNMWVSIHDTSAYETYTEEDEIYGCFYGHGAYSVWNKISDYKESEDGIEVTVNTYADLAYFAKAKTLVFHFDAYDNAGTPKLLGIDVISDSGLADAGVGF